MPDDNDGISEPSKIPPLMSIPFTKPPDDFSRREPKMNPGIKNPLEVILPKALEDVLAFKDLRELELGDEEPVQEEFEPELPMHSQNSAAVISSEYAYADVDSEDDEFVEMTAIRGQGKNDKNRQKKKRK